MTTPEESIPHGVVWMFRDLAARIEVPTREAVVLEDGAQVMLQVPGSDHALAGSLNEWSIGVSGASDGECVEVVVVAEDDDGATMGYGAVLRPDGGTLTLAGPILMLRAVDDATCVVAPLLEDDDDILQLLVRAAAGTLLAWTMPEDGEMLH